MRINVRDIQIDRFWLFFAAATAAGLLAKIGILNPGFTSDDFFYGLLEPNTTWHAVSQGRFLDVLIQYLIIYSGYTRPAIQIPAFLVSVLALSALLARCLDKIILPQGSLKMGALAAAVGASFPYLSAYYLFRMVIIDQIIIYIILYFVIGLMTNRNIRPAFRVILGSAAVGVLTGDNQLILLFLCVISFAWLASLSMNTGYGPKISFYDLKIEWLTTLATLFFGAIFYYVILKIVQHSMGIPGESSYTPDWSKGLSTILFTDLSLARDILFIGEPVIPHYAKILLLILVGYLLVAGLSSFRNSAIALAFLIIAVCIAGAPMAMASGGHVARIFVTAGFGVCLFIGLSANWVASPRIPLVIGSLLLCIYISSGATMFFQQAALSRWDLQQASDIYTTVGRLYGVDENTVIRLVNGRRTYGVPLSSYGENDYGVNESAFRSDWGYALPGLFSMATGKALHVGTGDASLCIGRPRWPAANSTAQTAPNEILVCL